MFGAGGDGFAVDEAGERLELPVACSVEGLFDRHQVAHRARGYLVKIAQHHKQRSCEYQHRTGWSVGVVCLRIQADQPAKVGCPVNS
jgi:hypothetical protein